MLCLKYFQRGNNGRQQKQEREKERETDTERQTDHCEIQRKRPRQRKWEKDHHVGKPSYSTSTE